MDQLRRLVSQQPSQRTTAGGLTIPPKAKRGLRKVIGTYSAKALAHKHRRRQADDIYDDVTAQVAKSHRPDTPLVHEELTRFRGLQQAESTAKARSSQLRKVLHLARREMPELRGMQSDKALCAALSPRGVELVGAALAAHGIASGANYIGAWKCYVRKSRPLSSTTLVSCRLARRAISKLRPWSRQATELPLEKLMDEGRMMRSQPMTSGGPQWPYYVAVLMTLWMWRGLEARSARRAQVTYDELRQAIIYTVGRRKNCQHGNRRPREIALKCICHAHVACPHCITLTYLRLSEGTTSKFLFSNKFGRPLTARALNETFRAIGKSVEIPHHATAHSARVSGSRHWAALGASELSIAALGDWRCLRVLRSYIGTARLNEQLARELSFSKTTRTSQFSRQPATSLTLRALVELKKDVKELLANSGPAPTSLPQYAIVTKRQPRRWHLAVCHGPSNLWHTRCGDNFNVSTMVLQTWNEKPCDEPTCAKCSI